MALLQLLRTVVRRNMFLPPVRWVSREEAEYWLQMSKKQDVFPKVREASKISKLEHLDEFGPRISPSVFNTEQFKDNFTNIGSEGYLNIQTSVFHSGREVDPAAQQLAAAVSTTLPVVVTT